MLIWASKFATAKIECSFELDKETPLGGSNIYFAGEGTFYSRAEVWRRSVDFQNGKPKKYI